MPERPEPKARQHPYRIGLDAPSSSASFARPVTSSLPYTELHITSNFTFLTGASHPEELIEQAAAIGHSAVAITDRNSVAGIVRAHVAAKQVGIPLVVGCRLDALTTHPDIASDKREEVGGFGDSAFWRFDVSLLLFATDVASYGRMCRLLTVGKRRAPKGECHLTLHDVMEHHEGLLAVLLPPPVLDQRTIEIARGLKRCFDDDRFSIAASCLYGEDQRAQLAQLAAFCQHVNVPMVATNNVHYHVPERRALQDVITCIRHGCTLPEAGHRLFPNAERHLKSPEAMAHLFAEYPEAIARTNEIADRATRFNLDQLRYQYPDEICPPGLSPMAYLTDLAWKGALWHYAHSPKPPDNNPWEWDLDSTAIHNLVQQRVPQKVRDQIRHELKLIGELNYAPYFLTVYDLVCFARSRGILCQGRGAAANSAVCYCLGVTSVDPNQLDLLFERFVSHARNEPPDIDIDFEHERREEVIQYIYKKYGRERAALTAEVITYRGRSAVREVGKALGLSLDCVDRLSKSRDWWDSGVVRDDRLRELRINPNDPTIRNLIALTQEILGFPRHLSQHVGGFVITHRPLCELVPIENAAMPDRTVIEWDKDDIDAMGMLKVDCLGLGMLTCIRKAFGMVKTEATKEKLEDQRQYDEPGTSRVSGYVRYASRRATRSDLANAALSRFRAIEHRQGTRTSGAKRLHPSLANCTRITGRTRYPIRTGSQYGDDRRRRLHARTDSRGRSHSPGTHPEPGKENLNKSPTPSSLSLSSLPPNDPHVYDMLCAGDAIGVFQVESRAQLAMLPRLRPRSYYDLVIEVAIVRPGPIQGKMVHPYLRRRAGEEPVEYPDEKVKRVLSKTLGVPIFQEQAMQLAMVAAGFTAEEADQLRRTMAAWKRKGHAIAKFGEKLISGMLANGYSRAFADRCFEQIKGFSEYGFPESHAASFAHLVYVSAWLKHYHPAAFTAALINSQPMGFYAPAQLIRDAQEHGVEVRPVDVHASAWDCGLEKGGVQEQRSEGAKGLLPPPALRLGFRLIKGLREDDAHAIALAVQLHGPFQTLESLRRHSGVSIAVLKRLASADALQSMGLDRQHAQWEIGKLRDEALPLFDGEEATMQQCGGRTKRMQAALSATGALLPPISLPRQVSQDYRHTGLSLKAHPMAFIRDELDAIHIVRAGDLKNERCFPQRRWVRVAGLAICRQRPGTASGIVFITLEDETGIANLIVRPKVYEKYRAAARHGTALLVSGRIERKHNVIHIMSHRIETLDERLHNLVARSRDFR